MVAARPDSERWATRVLVTMSIVAVIVTVVGYIAIIRQAPPSPTDFLTVPFVSTYLVSMAVMLAVSLIERPRIKSLRPALRAAASAGLVTLGVLASFPSAPSALIAAAFAIAATVVSIISALRRATFIGAAIGAVLSLAWLAFGLEVAWNVIVCPPTGQSSGITVSGVNYDCNDGELTVHYTQ